MELPDWLSIYYLKMKENVMRCNICEETLNVDDKSISLLDHIKAVHKEVYDLHKVNPEATVGFRIEYLHLNILSDDGDPKTQPVIIGEVCETTTEEPEKPTPSVDFALTPITKPKKRRETTSEPRKKSWVWKYFDRISDIIYRCKLCDSILSIKGCNTNNMNRHVRSRHSKVFEEETTDKEIRLNEVDGTIEIEHCFMKDDSCTSDLESAETAKSLKNLPKRSWIWLYFNRISSSLAQCKICHRNINHGGNATGNMNRHLKMIHNKTGPDDFSWVWKVFDKNEDDDFYTCKICQYRCIKDSDVDKSISCIRHHLEADHGVVSGDQIIT